MNNQPRQSDPQHRALQSADHRFAANYQVVIVGAGPCGITAANLLGAQSIHTLIIDREKDILRIPRAIGICEEGSRILAAAGILGYVEDGLRDIDRVVFADKHQQSVLFADLNRKDNGYRPLRTFYQPDLELGMREAVRQYDSVHLITETELISATNIADEVELSVRHNADTHQIRCRYLLACDGARSSIRKSLNIGFTGNTYPQDWVIIDINKNPLDDSCACFGINPERPSVTLPGPGDIRRWEFVVKNDEDPQQLCSADSIARLLKPWARLDDIEVARTAVYTFHARSAEHYRQGRIFLLGDAAHITPPFAGQGMMAGLRDAYNLCWKLSAVLKGQLRDSLLDSYESERLPQSQQVINFAQIMGYVILPQQRWVARIRDGLIRLLAIMGLHSKTRGLDIKKIPDHINGSFFRHLLVHFLCKTGTRLPLFELNPPLYQKLSHKPGSSRNNPQNIDARIGEHFCLCTWNSDAEAWLQADTLKRWNAIGGKSLCFSDKQRPVEGIVDTAGVYKNLFASGERVIAVRPDKMIVLNCKPNSLDSQLRRYLDQTALAQNDRTTCSAAGTI